MPNTKLPKNSDILHFPDARDRSRKPLTKNDKRRQPLSKKRAKQQIINFDEAKDNANKIKRLQRVDIIPRNTGQEEFLDKLYNTSNRILFAVGPAGTGKTLLSVLRAIQAYKNGEVTRIVITRPAVSVDEKHGFLPGDINRKMEPWTRPIFDIFEEYWAPRDIENMLGERMIEIAPLAYMRGRTFKNCFIVADEMQNATPEQMKMLLTRIGEGSTLVVTGDLKQHDRGYDNNGLKDFIEKLEYAECSTRGIVACHFNKSHVERDPVVCNILDIYGEE